MQQNFFSCVIIITFFILSQSGGNCGQFLEKQRSDRGIEFISGGVGISERNVLEGLEKDYNLKMVFAKINGKYLSGIKVCIQNPSGDILIETTTEGPWLLAKLPVGAFTITAICRDKSQSRAVIIGLKAIKTFFHFKDYELFNPIHHRIKQN